MSSIPLQISEPMTLIGLMSGTSVDAVDACCVRLSKNKSGKLDYQILGTYTQPILDHLRKRLLACMQNQPVSLKELCSLDTGVGALFANAVYGLLQQHKIPKTDITAIASHGQTVFHNPPQAEGLSGQTLQIGNAAIIAEHTGIPVVSDFRSRDMAVGGQGAPLVCLADQYLFQDEQLGRCIQNIGGIGNVTVLPAKNQCNDKTPVIAFDTGPGNMLIDGAMALLFEQPYDKNGETAKQGKVDQYLKAWLLTHPYYELQPPKTTGRELFGKPYLDELLNKFSTLAAESPQNIITSLTDLTAHNIADAYQRFVFPDYSIDEVVLGGGGVKNSTLMNLIAEKLNQNSPKEITIKTHQDFGIDDQYKEALAFAILGWATLSGIPGNMPSCTGAARPVILGNVVL